jgi:hypothetical protein
MNARASVDNLTALYEQLGTVRPREDRRRHPRVRAADGLVAAVSPAGGGVAAAAATAMAVRDLSRSGMAVASADPVGDGERVVAEFSLAGRPVRATCRVVNCRQLEGGAGYVVGMEFERVERPAENGDLSGDLLDAAEVMSGAEAGHVNDVARRLRALMRG